MRDHFRKTKILRKQKFQFIIKNNFMNTHFPSTPLVNFTHCLTQVKVFAIAHKNCAHGSKLSIGVLFIGPTEANMSRLIAK